MPYSYNEVLNASTDYFGGDDLASKVFVDKYALKNGDEYFELTPQDMHKRIAKELARIEKTKFKKPLSEDQIFSYLDHFKYIIPQGSCMFGIGNDYQTVSLSNCFHESTRILTLNDGVKKICDAKIEDLVVTDNGTVQKVSQLHKTKVENNRLFEVKCLKTPTFICTDNHKFLSISKEQLEWGYTNPIWNDLEYLRVGDYIALPNLSIIKQEEVYFDISKLISKEFINHNTNYLLETLSKTVNLTTIWNSGSKTCRKKHRYINRYWEIDRDFAYFLGLWYGDGCIFSNNKQKRNLRNRKNKTVSSKNKIRGITFTFNSKEKDIIEFVTKFGKKLFGIEPDCNDNSNIDGSYQIVFHSTTIGIVFEELFGRGCDGKCLYNGIYKWSDKLVEALTCGLIDSDGCISRDGCLVIVLNNTKLVESWYHLLRSRGQFVGITYGIGKQKYARLSFPKYSFYIELSKRIYKDDRIELLSNIKKSQNGLITLNGYSLIRIDKKIQYKNNVDYVYNLGVENVHSYNVEGLICKNCYLLDIPLDSYADILRVDEQLVQISKRRGGVGIDLSNLRPVGTKTNNSSMLSTGIVTFMDRYSNSIREVGQNNRRGALMLTLDVHHPQVLDFATAKLQNNKVTGANISVRLSKEFLDALEQNKEYEQRFPVDSRNPQISKMVKAKDVWDKLIECSWQSAEPGLLFWDNFTRETPADYYEEFKSKGTNPCSHACSKNVYIKTDSGIKEIKNVTSNDLVWVTDAFTEQWVPNSGYFKSGVADVYEVKFSNEDVLYVTNNHSFAVVGGFGKILDLIPLHSLSIGNEVLGDNGNIYKIESINYYSTEEVGCINVPNFGFFVTEKGLISGNSELNLSPLDSCRLLCLNLYSYVKNPFQDNAYFDYMMFYQHAQIAQRLMDDIVDLESEKIQKIIEKVELDPEPLQIKQRELDMWKHIKKNNDEGRRTGTGITALGDTLAALNIRYGSEQSIEETERIYRTLKFGCYRSSVDMAKELGPFKCWDFKKEKDCPFLNRFKDETIGWNRQLHESYFDVEAYQGSQLFDDMQKYGRRNISLLTTAPTGSLSLLTQTSSGIEPVFMLNHKRRKKINPNTQDYRVDFTDQNGDKWQEFEVSHPKILEWKKITEKTDIKDCPWYGCCAEDINWENRVKLQAAAQKHVCHAISSTINLPENVSKEEVAKIYETAWKSGCFRSNNHVYTETGIKDISEITNKDMVYGHDGKLHKIKEIFDLPIENRNFIKLNIIGHEGIESTEEHPFLTVQLDKSENKKSWSERNKKIVWKMAKDIQIDDHLLIPKRFYRKICLHNNAELDLKEYINSDFILDNGQIWLSRILPWSKNKTVKASNSNPIPEKIQISKDFCWFLGWFIAEGHFDSESYLRLTLNPNTEEYVAERCLSIIENIFNIKGFTEIIESNNGKSLRVQFGSKLLCEIFRKLCGQYSENKHLPEWFTYLDNELLSIIIDNHYNGDKGVTISPTLAKELFMAQNLLDKQVYMSKNYGSGFEVKEKNTQLDTFAKYVDNYKAYRVFSIENYVLNEKVYNFSVEGSDSYIVNGMITHNCKGITVYRKNCRTGVLIENKDSVQHNNAAKRPKTLPCDIHHFTIKGHRYCVMIGLFGQNGQPYEVFSINNHSSEGDIIVDKKIVKGQIIKNGRGNYIVEYEGGSQQINHQDPNLDAMTRLVSTSLRHNCNVKFLVEQLSKSEGDLLSFHKCIGRALKTYIKDGEIVSGMECPQCGGTLQFVQNCPTCSCGYSRCS